MTIGLLLLRIMLSAVLLVHATQKICGWFSGPGRPAAAAIFESLGQRPGRKMLVLAVLCELGGAAMVGLGVATPLGAAVIAGTMLVAGGSMTLVKGTIWNAAGGGEYPLILAMCAVVLGFTAPGPWSVDAALNAWWMAPDVVRGGTVGAGVLVVAVLTAGPALLRTHKNLTNASRAGTPSKPQT